MDRRRSRLALALTAAWGATMLLLPARTAPAGELCGAAPAERPGMPGDADRRWNNGATLAVLFMDGPDDAWGRVAGIANQWSDHANLTLTYHAPGTVDPSQAHIRVSFACALQRTAIGTDATVIAPLEPTLCLPDPTGLDEAAFSDAVLHHFGHALGLLHPVPGASSDAIYGTRLDASSIMGAEIRRSEPRAGSPRLSWVDREAAALLYPGHAAVAMTIGIRDGCPDGEPVHYRIFDATRGQVWPGDGGDWTTRALGVTYQVELPCTPGARVCHGAGAGDRSWGLGLAGDQPCEDCCYFCAAGVTEPWVLDCGQPSGPRKVALRAASGRHVTAALASGEDGSLRAISPRIKPWEKFVLSLADDGTVSLQAADGRFARVSPGDGVLRVAVGDPEGFVPVELGGGQIALMTADGRHVTVGEDADSTLTVVGEDPGPAGAFVIVSLD